MLLCWFGFSATVATAAEPYLRLRETVLGYHGAAEDFTNLTEIRIGWFGPSDPEDPLTGDLWWAATQAAAEAKGLPVRLIPRGSVDPWGTGVSQLTRMVYDEQPLALLGSVDSATTHLAEQVVAKAQLPLVSPIATDPTMTLAGVSWMFSCAPSDVAVAEALGEGILAALGEDAESVPGGHAPPWRAARSPGSGVPGRRWALIAADDHETRMTAREVIRACSRRGRLPDHRFAFEAGRQDLAPQLKALAEARVDVVLVLAGAEDAARIVRGLRDALPAATLFGGPAVGRRAFALRAGQAGEGVRYPRLSALQTEPMPGSFVERFTRERGHAPDYTALLSYDATQLLIAAIHRAGQNRARIREALVALSPWPGLAGEIRFDGTGQNVRGRLALAVIGGKSAAALDRGRPARIPSEAVLPDTIAPSHPEAGGPPAVQFTSTP